MFSSVTLLYVAIPIGLVVVTGELIRRRGDPETVGRRYFLFLIWTAFIFLFFPLLAGLASPMQNLVNSLTLLLAPITTGLIVMILLRLHEWQNLQDREQHIILSVFLCLVATHIWFILSMEDARRNEPIFLDLATLTIAAFLFLVWIIGRRHPILLGWISLLYMLLFNLLEGGALPLFEYSASLWVSIAGAAVYLILPALVISTATVLILHMLSNAQNGSVLWHSRISSLILALAVLGSFFYTTFWLGIWDGTDDGIRVIIMLMLSMLTAIAGGLVIAMTSSGWRRWVGLAFAVVVFGLMRWAIAIPNNNYHPYDVTEARAAHIQQAIENYRIRTGWYPLKLQELVPGEMLRIPLPMIMPDQKWCYQGGSNYYRLGTIYREHWSSPYLSVRVYATAGDMPDGSWECDERLAELIAHSNMETRASLDTTPLPPGEISIPRTMIKPIYHATALVTGDWSPNGDYLVFGETRLTGDADEPLEIDLKFFDAKTGEVCIPVENQWKAGERSDGLHEHYAWLPEGRLLYVSGTGAMVLYTPCTDVVENITDRYPVQLTHVASVDMTGGHVLLKNQNEYWLLDGTSLEATHIQDLSPISPEYSTDRYAWSPGGDRMAIAKTNAQDASAGATIHLVNGTSGTVEMNIPLVGNPEQVDAPLVDWLNNNELLVQFAGSLTIVDIHSNPPAFTNLIKDIFVLDLSYPMDFSSMDFVRQPDDEYIIAVRVNHPHNQDAYLYDSETGKVSIFQSNTSLLLLAPDGALLQSPIWEDTPSYRDEYDLVLMDHPDDIRHLMVEGHTPRSYPQLIPRYLILSSQMVFSSSQGISLVSLPDGKTIRFWTPEGGSNYYIVIPSPDDASLAVADNENNLYYIPLAPE